MDIWIKNTYWCRIAQEKRCGSGFILYRRKFTAGKDSLLELAVSADCRYNLYLDGRFLGRGPVRGDLEHYNYEIYRETVAPGDHLLAAEVTAYGDPLQMPWSEVHFEHAFMAAGHCGDTDLSAPAGWVCFPDISRRYLKWQEAVSSGTYPAPQPEAFTADACPGRWREYDFDDSSWYTPEIIARCAMAEGNDNDPPSRWKLMCSGLPQMTAEPVTGAKLSSKTGGITLLDGDKLSFAAAPGRNVLLIDLGKYYTFFPDFSFSAPGCKGTVRIAYSESLWVEGKKTPAPAAGGTVGYQGYGDIIELKGGAGNFVFQPFWFRAGRFIEITFDIDSPLEITGISFVFSVFPLDFRAGCSSDDPVVQKIFDTGIHTARCCAHEHYEDCPYWEQMQYGGDTRIQALISYACADDGRLGLAAIKHFDNSRIASGLTMSRYPSNFRQIIPGFSLFWIMMIDDYSRYFNDLQVINDHWRGINDCLDYFESLRETNGLIGCAGQWNFSDWPPEWPFGKSDRNTGKPETLLNLLYIRACTVTAEMAERTGRSGEEYLLRSRISREAVNRCCRDRNGLLYRDVPDEEWYSQHTNCWAILSGTAPAEDHEALAEHILNDTALTQCTLYFSFYLLELMRKLGNEAGFRKILKKWEVMVDAGFTTFPESHGTESRSYCHAWSAGPCFFLAAGEGSEKRKSF